MAVAKGCYYDAAPALKVRRFLEIFCIQSKAPWAGKPLSLLPWQWDELILPLYAWHNADGTRRYKKAGVWIPKKQGKSTLLSGLCLWHLLEEAGSEVYCIASDVQQAAIVFNESASMVELSPNLIKRLWVRRNLKQIEDQKRKSIYRVLSSSPEGKSGFNANLICYDELAEWGSGAREVWDRLANATIARPNGLQIVISTAQFDKTSVGYEQYRYAKQVKQGDIEDTTFLPLIYEVGEHEDWRDPVLWQAANPSWGVTVPAESFHSDYKTIQNNPIEEARFRTLRLNQWVGHSEAFLASNVWASCYEDFDERDLHGEEAFLGIDFSWKRDLAAYVILVPKDEKVFVIPRFFIPEDTASKAEKRDNVPYSRWSPKYLTLTPGEVIDPKLFRQSILDDAKRFKIVECRYDPYCFEESRQVLEYEHDIYMVECPQTYTVLSAPTAHFAALVQANKIRHNGNPVLTWNLGNCAVRQDTQERILIDKRKSTGRIDGITATIIGLSGIMAQEDDWGFMPELL